jgi:hypothetical protein
MTIQPHDVVIQDFQPVVGQGRTQGVLAQGQAALPVVGGDLGSSVKIEPGVLPT